MLQEFYEFTTKHRKLTWIYALGTCIVKGEFDQKTIELNLFPFQAATLLLFNTGVPILYMRRCSAIPWGSAAMLGLVWSLLALL